ncbi:MAG: AAA family ATPase, partial [Verrucomicrobia bacterium]|nr:AAA family ATPase [Verrucomicrobiota bacterium]
MLFRKIQSRIQQYLKSDPNKVLIVSGARQVGKTYIIRDIGGKLFRNYVEINLLEDSLVAGLFKNVRTVEDFYLALSMKAGDKMRDRKNTLVFLDEIQAYPHLLTLLKFLKQDNKYTYIASGSLLGVTLAESSSIPIGSIEVIQMYPLDFEEFLWANGFGDHALDELRQKFFDRESLDKAIHLRLMDLLKKYLLVGGLPDAVNSYLKDKNIAKVRAIQREIHEYYGLDAAKYDGEHRLKIRRIFEMIPS